MTDEISIMVDVSTLYIVPTPIGNLGDITQRALDVLNNVDLIAAEDKRHSSKLLSHFGINTPMFALHDHNEQQKADFLIQKLVQGCSIALISDAGTPLISDPGYHLVNRCRQAQIKVVPLPGPCAVIAALSASGLASDRFSFEGFLPPKSKGRQDKFNEINQDPRTLIFYESPHRIIDSLNDMLAILGKKRQVVLARELTKTYETIYGAPLEELIAWLKEDPNRTRGEIVVLVAGFKAEKEVLKPEALRALAVLANELPLKKAAALVAELYPVKKNALYKWGLANLASE